MTQPIIKTISIMKAYFRLTHTNKAAITILIDVSYGICHYVH